LEIHSLTYLDEEVAGCLLVGRRWTGPRWAASGKLCDCPPDRLQRRSARRNDRRWTIGDRAPGGRSLCGTAGTCSSAPT